MAGRFAPSPTGDLHVGNLRTALVAWLAARSVALPFIVRMEDLDRVTSSEEHERSQLADLASLGIEHDGAVVRQSDRFDLYRDAIEGLRSDGRVYPCYCTRREIRMEIDAAAAAPHGDLPDGAYPGTCRDLTDVERAAREAEGRVPALRLRADDEEIAIHDRLAGRYVGRVDDVVLQRRDGVPAYNLAVVVDDAAQGVTQVVRGDDLLSSTPRQVLLQQLLGLPTPEYVHLPLVLAPTGERLAKRHGAVTIADLRSRGVDVPGVLDWLAESLALPAGAKRAADLLGTFDLARIPREPVTFHDLQRSAP